MLTDADWKDINLALSAMTMLTEEEIGAMVATFDLGARLEAELAPLPVAG